VCICSKVSQESPAETNDRAEKGAAYVSDVSVDALLMETEQLHIPVQQR